MTFFMLRAIIVAPLAVILAGCVGDSGNKASVSFDGEGNGSHDDSTDCDSDGTVFANGEVDEGQVHLQVTDGDGTELYNEEFDGGINVDSEGLDGASGDWTISAVRTSDAVLGSPFNGDYTFRLAC